MHIGIKSEPTGQAIDIAVLARRAEELGFESLWVPEHPVLPVNTTIDVPREYGDYADPFVALARASAVTTKIKLGTGICLVPERNPLILAKEVASVDMFSNGRFLFGIGAGKIQEETAIMGGDFDHRWSQAREAVLAMKELWTKPEAEFHGKYYDFPPVYSFPKPVQRPHPPVLLGGKADNVFKRVVAWGDGWIPGHRYSVTPAALKQGRDTLNALAETAGRDPASIDITIYDYDQPADRDLIERYRQAGANRLVIVPQGEGEAESLAELERIAGLVLA